MASSLDIKSRDVRTQLDPNDPLMELTRIMGFTTESDSAAQTHDPQLAIEDEFSIDLENEIRENDLELPGQDFSIDEGFLQAFESELPHSQAGEYQIPAVELSFEDELSALLEQPNAPTHSGAHYNVDETYPQVELSFEDELNQALADPDLNDVDSRDLASLGNDENFDDLANNVHWSQADVDFDVRVSEVETSQTDEPTAEIEPENDPILSQMNRVFGRTNHKHADLHEVHVAQVTAPALQHAYKAANEPATTFDDYAMTDISADLDSEVESDEINQLDRLIGKTGLEPVVEAVEIESYGVDVVDDLDIPDFDLPTEKMLSDDLAFDIDDDFQSYKAPVAPASVPSNQNGLTPVFHQSPGSQDDDSISDFESLLNDELSASIDGPNISNPYEVPLAPVLSKSASYQSQNQGYADELPESLPQNDDFDEPVAYQQAASSKIGWFAAAALGAVALIGAGYYTFSGSPSGSQDGAPVLVKADAEPIKVAPETPGGKTVQNQDLAVYDKVGDGDSALPSQGQLISEAEEPVDIASVATNEPTDASKKSEERIDPALEAAIASGQASDTLAVAPKKVRTVVVKPDGTLVERPAEPVASAPVDTTPAPATAQEQTTAAQGTDASVEKSETKDESAQQVATAPKSDETQNVASAEPVATPVAKAEQAPAAAEPAIKVVKTKKIKAPAAEPKEEVAQSDSGQAPVLESRPADQPVNIVGQTGDAQAADQTQVAAADPVETPVATSAYSMQIASTPSAEAAKSTYAALNRKFGDVLGGRGVNVQKAEVEGKGTVYRLRIPAGTKQEAAALCQQYKAAGGNCFITK